MAGSGARPSDPALAAPLDPSAARDALAERMRGVHVTRVEEMPRIELYLDQVLTLVSQGLDFMRVPGEPLITGSMVNNYVKQGVVPPPRRKRYTRRHVAALLFVCALKRVFSIAQVTSIADRIYSSPADLSQLYDRCCDALERALAAHFPEAAPDGPGAPARVSIELVDEGGGPCAPELARMLSATVEALAAKVAVEQTLLLGTGEGDRA